jgi:hypothetical protein
LNAAEVVGITNVTRHSHTQPARDARNLNLAVSKARRCEFLDLRKVSDQKSPSYTLVSDEKIRACYKLLSRGAVV